MRPLKPAVMFKKMKLETLQDIEKLPSVIDVEEVSLRLVELVEVIQRQNVSPLEGAEAINDLISYQGCNETGLSIEASKVIFDWIKEVYDPSDKELIECNIANLANLTCMEAEEFLRDRLNLSNSDFERKEIEGALDEINTKT